MKDVGNFTAVAEFDNEREASIAAGMLGSNGIETFIDGSIMGTLYGAGATWALVRLLVPADKADKAKALLKEHNN